MSPENVGWNEVCTGCGCVAHSCRCDEFDDEVCMHCGRANCWCDDEPEGLEEECHGWFDAGVFVCGAVGSEDCDECACNAWLGLTEKEIDELEEEDLG